MLLRGPGLLGPLSAIASVLGSDETHTAYQVRLQITSMSNTVPDAWRFDPPGCQGYVPVGHDRVAESALLPRRGRVRPHLLGPGATTPGVNCGGFETPMEVRLLHDAPGTGQSTSYIRASDNSEHPFDVGNSLLTVNGAVPATGTTWGQVKSVYRR